MRAPQVAWHLHMVKEKKLIENTISQNKLEKDHIVREDTGSEMLLFI